MVTPAFLMQGAHYALEQCGLLLHDAIALFRTKSYATATVLAAFAREELGKARELRTMRREALSGATLTVRDVQRRCGANHVAKQDRGQTSTVLRFGNDSELGKLHRVLHENHPQSDEYQRADARVLEIVAEQRNRVPAQRHETRMRCLYVDPDETGTVWNRPKDQAKDEAQMFLMEAANDYSVQYDHYQRGNVIGEGKELYDALKQWTERPDLPAPEWPLL
jgi:AbiV family abortive infection protein